MTQPTDNAYADAYADILTLMTDEHVDISLVRELNNHINNVNILDIMIVWSISGDYARRQCLGLLRAEIAFYNN